MKVRLVNNTWYFKNKSGRFFYELMDKKVCSLRMCHVDQTIEIIVYAYYETMY